MHSPQACRGVQPGSVLTSWFLPAGCPFPAEQASFIAERQTYGLGIAQTCPKARAETFHKCFRSSLRMSRREQTLF